MATSASGRWLEVTLPILAFTINPALGIALLVAAAAVLVATLP